VESTHRLVTSAPTGVVVLVAGLLALSGNLEESRKIRTFAYKMFPMEWR
jgi:di/tricarboxylate transporter